MSSAVTQIKTALAPAGAAFRWLWRGLTAHPLNHWLAVVVVTLTGTLVSSTMHSSPLWQPARWWVYRTLQEWGGVQRTHSRQTTLVYIGDTEFWGPLNHTTPLERTYLADLITRIGDAHPAVIALDFALFKSPGGGEASKDDPLFKAVRALPRDTQFIVAAATHLEKTGKYAVESGVLDDEPRAIPAFYEVNDDVSELDLRRDLDRGGLLDSFSVAIARAIDPVDILHLVSRSGRRFPYSTFLPAEAFTTYRAGDVTAHDDIQHSLAHKVVIVGAQWHPKPSLKDDLIDLHMTPFGPMSGALLHANYVESLLERGMKFSVSEALRDGLEIALGFLIAIALTLGSRIWQFCIVPLTIVFLVAFT